MTIYRVATSLFANDLTGEGAKLFGGRWNHIDTPCVYASENRALALLEYTVNVNLHKIPRALSMLEIDIPEDEILDLDISKLPGNWKDSPAPSSTMDFGTAILKKAEYPVIRIPSTVIPKEYNYLLNPAHSRGSEFKLLLEEDFVFDVRIKKV